MKLNAGNNGEKQICSDPRSRTRCVQFRQYHLFLLFFVLFPGIQNPCESRFSEETSGFSTVGRFLSCRVRYPGRKSMPSVRAGPDCVGWRAVMALWVRIPRSLPASCSGVCSGRLLLGVSRESGRPLSREHLVSLAPHASPSPLPFPPQPFSSPRPLPSSACSSPGRGSKRTRSRPTRHQLFREEGSDLRGR